MKTVTLLAVILTLAACTQASVPSTGVKPGEGKPQSEATQSASEAPAPVTTPILSLLVGNSITPAAKGMWCLKDGTAPFTKLSIQDESIAAPIENQSAPLPGVSVAKDTATQQAPGTARVISQRGDSTFQIQWLSKGIKGDAQMMVQGDALSFTDDSDTASFLRCN